MLFSFSFIQTLFGFMQACLQKIVLQSLPYSIKVYSFKTIFECVSQSLFYKLLITILERIDFKLYFVVQAKSLFAKFIEFYLKISFISENMFGVGLKPCCKF
jgi:hypothetical protein